MFELSKVQQEKLRDWSKIQDEIALCIQKIEIKENDVWYEQYKQYWDEGYPYAGAVGGVLTYSFTMTSLGESVVVKNNLTNQEIDLTDYENW